MKARNTISRYLMALVALLALLAPVSTPAALAAGGGGEGSSGDLTRLAPVTAPAAATVSGPTAQAAFGDIDYLYIGDQYDNTVKRFDARNGAYRGIFVASGSGDLNGPRGIIFKGPDLYLVNQNAGTPYNSDILDFSASTGALLRTIAPCNAQGCDPNAPWNGRGMIAGPGNTLLVADLGEPGDPTVPGKIEQFDAKTGAFLGNFDASGFKGEFRPKGLVVGPDGLLYVSVVGNLNAGDVLTGYVLRFNTRTRKFVDVFVANPAPPANPGAGCTADLHRPEGLVFGPDGKLYVTSFRRDASDTDKIVIFNGRTGGCVKEIVLDQVGQDRAFAQALLFGPGGDLFVPITNNGLDNQYTGAVRRYNVNWSTFPYTNFVLPNARGGATHYPWYLTFGKTNPSTLAYGK